MSTQYMSLCVQEDSVEAYVAEAMKMLRFCETPISNKFFSVKNVNRIQKQIIQAVKQESGHNISRQSDREIVTIMRSVYEAFGTNIDSKEELQRLNDIVLDITVDQVKSGIQGYLQYIQDASTMPEPLSRGQFASVKGLKNLEMTYGMPSKKDNK